MELFNYIDKLRGTMTLEEVQELIINIIKGEDIEEESKDKIAKELIQRLKNANFSELQNTYYNLQIMNKNATSNYTESIESLALAIFKKHNKGTSLLDLGSGEGHMLWRSSTEGQFKYLCGEEINTKSADTSKVLLSKSDLNIEINNIDSTMNFSNKNKFDYIYSDALFLNADNERLKKIEKNTSTNYLKTRSKFSEWIFTNRILNNLNDGGIGVIVLRDAAMFTEMAKDIRKDLIENNLVKAVIQLPSNLITNTAISTTLLVLQKHSEDNVVFVNASDTYTKKGRLQKVLETKDIKSIMNGLSTDTEISKKVSKEVIKSNDYNLSPVRYLVNIEDRLLNPVKLTDIVEAIRGKDVSKKKLDDEQNKDKAGYLLNLSDLKDFKINIPKQKISQEILDEYDKYLIKPMDIVISTRSSELKIAIANESLARNNIIISSNFNILRVKDNKISPYYLFAFLTSQIGTEQFEQLMTGTVINVISQKALQEYKVSLLSQEAQEDIAFKMEEELVEYYGYLNKIQRFQNKLPQLFHENGGE